VLCLRGEVTVDDGGAPTALPVAGGLRAAAPAAVAGAGEVYQASVGR
jgi:hypothetical protein